MTLLLVFVTGHLYAHVVSMSTGELRVDGPLADYELRMPMYEIAHVSNPETLLDHIRFAGAHRVSSNCHEENGTYVCAAHYEFSGLIDRVEVECTFYQVTVPNHVHLLRAVQGSNGDQAVFDQTFPRAELRFRPPSRFEILSREMLAGLWRAIVSPAAIFLLVLMVAARSAREGGVAGGRVPSGAMGDAAAGAENSISVVAAIRGGGYGTDRGVPGARGPGTAASPEAMGGGAGAGTVPWTVLRCFPVTYLAGAQVFEAAAVTVLFAIAHEMDGTACASNGRGHSAGGRPRVVRVSCSLKRPVK